MEEKPLKSVFFHFQFKFLDPSFCDHYKEEFRF